MNKIIFSNKHIEARVFKNLDGHKMFSFQFLVDEASDDSYRGFKLSNAKKVAKWLKKLSKTVKGLQKP